MLSAHVYVHYAHICVHAQVWCAWMRMHARGHVPNMVLQPSHRQHQVYQHLSLRKIQIPPNHQSALLTASRSQGMDQNDPKSQKMPAGCHPFWCFMRILHHLGAAMCFRQSSHDGFRRLVCAASRTEPRPWVQFDDFAEG